MTPSSATVVIDEAGVEFVLGEEIASGAQGAVYRVQKQPDLAIKLLKYEQDLARVRDVRRLPLDGLAVAAPTTLITTGGLGYVMPLASDMTCVKEPYLPFEYSARETNAAWYMGTGGLKRRLAICAHIAQTIASLHQRGLAYVDLNPNNVMVSDDLSRTETWLIDADNLTSRATPTSTIIGFPRYIAPERVTRRAPPSTLADTYALAVHVFRMLVLRHPLEGVSADQLDGQAARAAMDRGELAYVMDPADDSNRLPEGQFPLGLFPHVMSGRLRQLAQQTFAEGRLAPTLRPGAARWRDVIFHALDNVIDCQSGCGWSQYRLESSCPSCGASTNPSVVLTVYGEHSVQTLPARSSFVVNPLGPTDVLPRHLWGDYENRHPVLTVHPIRGGIELETHNDAVVTDLRGKAVSKVPIPKGSKVARVHVTVPDQPSRSMALRPVPAR
jgi:DNA-binding helix-hairpin-helix protein with protein kinase domain